MRLPNCLLVQTDARPHGGDTGLHRDSQPLAHGTQAPTASLPSSQVIGEPWVPEAPQPLPAGVARGARPAPSSPAPAPGPAFLRFGPRLAGSLQSLLAQPPPKPGEVESRRRRCLRGTRGAALGMLSRRSPSWSQVGSSCAAPAADPGAPGKARLEQSGRAPVPERARRASLVSVVFFLAFALDPRAARECWRETRAAAAAAACDEWLRAARLLLLSCRPLGLRGHCRPPRGSHSCSSCRRICRGNSLRSPVHPALAPQGRPGGTATAGSLLDFHPSRFPAPWFPRQPGLGGAWGGGRQGWRGCARVGGCGGEK